MSSGTFWTKGNFILVSYDNMNPWQILPYPSNLMREIAYANTTKQALFTAFNILGYRDGTIGLSVKFQQNFKIQVFNLSMELGFHLTLDLNEREKIFGLLEETNTIPPDHLEHLRKLVSAKNWYDVTPLTEKELRSLSISA